MTPSCTICNERTAKYEARFDTSNGRAIQDLCLRCLAGRMAAYPPNSINVPKDFQQWEITNMKSKEPGLSEEEMDELIESREWDPYYLECHPCRQGKHNRCKPIKQPTNHIDPHPTICICECRQDNELDMVRNNLAGNGKAEDDEFVFGDDEEDEDFDFDFEFDDDDDDEYVFD